MMDAHRPHGANLQNYGSNNRKNNAWRIRNEKVRKRHEVRILRLLQNRELQYGTNNIFAAQLVASGGQGQEDQHLPSIPERELLVPLPAARHSSQEVWRIRMVRERERNQDRILRFLDKEARRKARWLQRQVSQPKQKIVMGKTEEGKISKSEQVLSFSDAGTCEPPPKAHLPLPKDRQSYKDALHVRMAREKERRQEKILRLIEREERKKLAMQKLKEMETGSAREEEEDTGSDASIQADEPPSPTRGTPSLRTKSLPLKSPRFTPEPPPTPSRNDHGSHSRLCSPSRRKRRFWGRMSSTTMAPASNERVPVRMALLGSRASVNFNGTRTSLEQALLDVSRHDKVIEVDKECVGQSQNQAHNQAQGSRYTAPVQWFNVQSSPVRYRSKKLEEQKSPTAKKIFAQQQPQILLPQRKISKENIKFLDLQTFIQNVAKYKIN